MASVHEDFHVQMHRYAKVQKMILVAKSVRALHVGTSLDAIVGNVRTTITVERPMLARPIQPNAMQLARELVAKREVVTVGLVPPDISVKIMSAKKTPRHVTSVVSVIVAIMGSVLALLAHRALLVLLTNV